MNAERGKTMSEKRYIDKARLIKAIEDLPNCYNGFSDTFDKACIIGVIEELPTIDIIGIIEENIITDIVRCKDCRYGIEDDGWIYCHNFGETERKDFFCADGERNDT